MVEEYYEIVKKELRRASRQGSLTVTLAAALFPTPSDIVISHLPAPTDVTLNEDGEPP